jgi:hypothetical protein
MILVVHCVLEFGLELGGFHRYFAFPRTFEVVRSFAKLGETFTHGPGELRQLAWAKKY